MQVLLENIAFNHDPDLSKTGSFFLRRNETQVVPRPEWRNESCSNPECAPAGYVIAALPATLTIKASFLCDDPSVTKIHIKALDITTAGPGILGAIEATPVDLQNGRSGLVVFKLQNAKTRIIDAGISVSNIAWQWQFSTNLKNWTNFQTTEHRIFTVLEMPNEPWQPTSDVTTEIHVPWTEVLDYACEWAAGVKDEDEAATSITNRVYQLGEQELMRWDGGASYAHGTFDCTAFLQLLKRQIGNGHTVNCDDCATVVSTFSNVLGCNLFQSNMGFDFFTNSVLLIGHTEVSAPRFGNHAVAWKPDCDAISPLFDACLQIDTDGNPSITQTRHVFTQPLGLEFDTQVRGSYKSCLFNKGMCDPDPDSKQRRSLGRDPFGQPAITNKAFLESLKLHYEFADWDNDFRPGARASISSSPDEFQRFDDAFDGWNEDKRTRFENEEFSVIETVLKRDALTQELVALTVYKVDPATNPNDLLIQLLGRVQALHFERLKGDLGDVAFVAPGRTSVFFKRGSFVAAIRSVGFKPIDVTAVAYEADLKLADRNQVIIPREGENDMKPETFTEDPKTRAAGAHKLAENFSVGIFSGGAFQKNGKMDMTSMSSTGKLVNGKHTHGSIVEDIEAQAVPAKLPNGRDTFEITVQTKDGSATYQGVLLLDTGNELAVGGCFKFSSARRAEAVGDVEALAQDEGVWVITKP